MATPFKDRTSDGFHFDTRETQTSSTPIGLYSAHPIPEDKGYIRVLELANSAGDEPLQGHLRVVNLKEWPQYAALSYVWGSDAPSLNYYIRCDNYDLKISPNCWMALRSLRTQFGATALWVDSICINQVDAGEKSRQIPQMGDIYSSAAKTFVWLGPGNNATNETTRSTLQSAASWVLKPRAHAETMSTGAWDYHRYKTVLFLYMYTLGCLNSYRQIFELLREVMLHLTRALGHRHDQVQAAMPLHDLLGAEWLQRSWTFQEILLSSNPYIVWGNVSMDWLDFIRGIFHLRKDFGAVGRAPTWLVLFESWNKMPQPIALLRRNSPWGPERRPFRSRADAYSRVSEFSMASRWAYILLVIVSIYGLPHTFILLLTQFVPLGLVGSVLVIAGTVSLNVLLFLSTPSIERTWTGLSLYTGGAEYWKLFMNDKRPGQNEGDSRQLFEVIHALHERRAMDPKDKVFSLYGILDRLGFDLPLPTYSSSVSELYYQWYIAMLQQTPKALNMLLSAGSATEGPSWVPDWRTISQRRWLPPTIAFDSFADSTIAESPQFELAGKELRVHVRFLGRIQDALSQGDLEEMNDEWKLQACTHLLIWFYKWHIKHPDYLARHPTDGKARLPPPWTDAFRTRRAIQLKPLTTYLTFLEEKAEIEQHLDAMHNEFRSRVPDLEAAKHHLLSHPQTYDAVSRHLTMNTLLEYNDGWIRSLRKLVVFSLDTLRGTTHAFASPETVVGDTIAIIAGVSTPLILRSVDGHDSNRYKVVGQAFADELTYPCTAFNQSTESLPMLTLV